MTRILMIILFATTTILLPAFGVAMALSYAINERCTDQMAQQGNC